MVASASCWEIAGAPTACVAERRLERHAPGPVIRSIAVGSTENPSAASVANADVISSG